MIVIYHNPRCSKSRECLSYMETSKHDFSTVKYMDEALSVEKLKKILKLLKFTPIELVRKNEAIWKDTYKGKNLSDEEIINAMIEHPKLMQRPIVINGDKAVVGRPPERVIDIL
jgi:arsenate reductase (glutaredoxin)